MALNSQDLKVIFTDKNNNKPFEVVAYAAFNEYPIKGIVLDGNKIILITEDIGGFLNQDDDEDNNFSEGPTAA